MTISVTSWDGNAINDGSTYTSGFHEDHPALDNAPVAGNEVGRYGRYPLVGGVTHQGSLVFIETVIEAAGVTAARAALRTIFETESGEIKTLIVDTDDGTESYIQAVCEAHYEADSPGLSFISQLRVHDDPAWRGTTLNTDTESITGTGQQWTIANDGDQIARPVIKVKPTSAISGDNPYRRFMAVRWFGGNAQNYPVDIANNALDTQIASTNFDSATGDDIRVRLNGIEVDFWIDDPDTNNTSLWVNLDMQAAVDLTLAVAIASSGTVETIDVNEDISALPPSGILLIGSEIFIYSAKNNQLKRFTIDARAAKGTSMAAHSVSDDVYWIQHDIEIQYGSSSLSAYSPDNNYKPMFTLASSTNGVWDFDFFGENDGLRTGSWIRPADLQDGGSGTYKKSAYDETEYPNFPDDPSNSTNPWQVMGLQRTYIPPDPASGHDWRFFSPVGLTGANFTNGERYAEVISGVSAWRARIQSRQGGSWFVDYDVPLPTVAATWQTWSQNPTWSAGTRNEVRLQLLQTSLNLMGTAMVEVSDVALTFDSNLTPTSYIAPELGNYTINATLTNTTTGDILEIDYTTTINNTLRIDTVTGEVLDEGESSNQYQAVVRKPTPRIEWLPLAPGNNLMQWDETGVAGLDVTIEWRERRSA